MKILIVDDQQTNRLILKYLLEADGHQCIEAEDGADGVQQFQSYAPDFVLMDVVMPNMDGYQATREIKSLCKEHYIPIIFLTARHDEASLLKCLESGGDDFLTKPVNEIMLKAKIAAHSRTQELNEQVVSKNAELTFLHNALQEEYRMGEHVVGHASQRNVKDCDSLRSYLSPKSVYNGDVLLSAYRPDGGICLFLGDFTGHGLAASIGAVPISQTFFTMCAKGLSAVEIIKELNSVLKEFLPEHMFCAATLVDLNREGDKAQIWAGGLPSGLVVRPGSGVVGTIESKNMPLGILPSSGFNAELELLTFEHGDRIVLFTDGILEGLNLKGEMLGEKAIVKAVDDGQDAFASILEAHERHTKDANPQDDISIVELVSSPIEQGSNQSALVPDFVPWQVSVKLDPEKIRHLADPILDLVTLLPDRAPFARHKDMVRTILTEFYSNSLEHGLLELDSRLKDEPEGFVTYYEQRETRLQSLNVGEIHFRLQYINSKTNSKLKIHVKDSGSGFEIDAPKKLEENTFAWGRGLPMIQSLCKRVEFLGDGSEVVAEYILD